MGDKLFDSEKLVGEIQKAESDTNWTNDTRGYGITFSRLLECLKDSIISFDDSVESWKKDDMDHVAWLLRELLEEPNLIRCGYC